MDSKNKKKYYLFLAIIVIFLVFTAKRPYNNRIFQLSKNNASVSTKQSQQQDESNDSFFPLSLPSFFSDDKNRITNDNCGISFKIPEGWNIFSVEEGERFCNYYIKNPEKRGATLQIGVPFSPSMSETIDWNELIQYMNSKTTLKSASIPRSDEAYQTERTVTSSPQGESIGDPMYLFRKNNAVYFMRYGYVDYDGRNMLDDISSVVSSIRFQMDSEFYKTPLRSSP